MQGVSPTAVFGTTQQRTIAGGNLNLEAETAKVLTTGVVFEPPQVKGLSLTVDYWNIDITKAIQSLGDVIRDAEAFGMPVVRWRAALERVRLLHHHGRAEAAGREARETRALLERFASALPEPLAQTFRQSEAMRCASSLLASAATAK